MSDTANATIATTIPSDNDEELLQIQNVQINDQEPSGSAGNPSLDSVISGKEEIRRRLAFEIVDDDDPIAQYKLNHRKTQKSTLSSRMQNIDSLQICFLNENNESYTFGDLNHTNLESATANDIIVQNRIYYLTKKLQKHDYDLNQVDLFADIEKPVDCGKFSEYHSKLYTEAKFILSQIKEIVKLKLKFEEENEPISSIYQLIHNFPPDFHPGQSKLTVPILKRLRCSEIQLIVNDMYSRIEKLNGDLVKLLITRDELYMEQDSLLVDIEDLTKFLLSK